MSSARFMRSVFLTVTWLCLSAALSAQTSSMAPKKPARTDAPAPPNEPRPTASQVVTIVHRLNGLKMFRLLARSEDQVQAIANLDEAFNFTDDVHTNIIAGLAMDDGRTIAAWLPDAEVEFGPGWFAAPPPPAPPDVPTSALPRPVFPASPMNSSQLPFKGGMFGSPDLTVIAPDGRRLAAQYVGLDGATGLSILRLTNANLNVNNVDDEKLIGEGETIRVINPEPAESKPVPTGGLYVRMGATLGTVLSVRRAPAGDGVARFKVKSPRLSLLNIGGVVVNETGETIGIVNAVQGSEATILPTRVIRRAAKRVLAQQASVPRPWLGVKGEPISSLNVEQIRNQGWRFERAASLLDRHLGILLTSIAPGSPAANAALRPGDVILRVNNKDVTNDDDFSWMLDQAGPSGQVVFTLARPDRPTEQSVNVELSGLLDPALAFRMAPRPATIRSLLSEGIETIALKSAVAARLGATSGLLVVYVDPATPAFDAGLLPGDVIESINGKPLEPGSPPPFALNAPPEKARFEIVRKKQKLVVTVNTAEKKKP